MLLKTFVFNCGVYQHLSWSRAYPSNLFRMFPNCRDAHFVIGEEDEKKTEEDDKISSDPKYVLLMNSLGW